MPRAVDTARYDLSAYLLSYEGYLSDLRWSNRLRYLAEPQALALGTCTAGSLRNLFLVSTRAGALAAWYTWEMRAYNQRARGSMAR